MASYSLYGAEYGNRYGLFLAVCYRVSMGLGRRFTLKEGCFCPWVFVRVAVVVAVVTVLNPISYLLHVYA